LPLPENLNADEIHFYDGSIITGWPKRDAAMMMYIYPKINKRFNKYGLFSEFKPSNYVDNCLIIALRYCLVDESILTNIKMITKGKLFIKTN
jgi:hypothetical protein